MLAVAVFRNSEKIMPNRTGFGKNCPKNCFSRSGVTRPATRNQSADDTLGYLSTSWFTALKCVNFEGDQMIYVRMNADY